MIPVPDPALGRSTRWAQRSTAARMWAAGIRIGLSSLRREPVLALKRLVLPVSYWRTAEFAYAWRKFDPLPSGRLVFDLGSPKDLASILARYRRFDVIASDILPEAVQLARRSAAAQGLIGTGGCALSAVIDGRAIPHRADTFDASFSISVLEHIPGEGDTSAIREIVRVTKPGGLVVATVPFARRYRESFLYEDVYERRQQGDEPVFFERHYDTETLRSRLIDPSGAELIDLEIWGEAGVRVESRMNRLPFAARALVSPLEPLLSLAFLRQVNGSPDDHPMAAFLTLGKPS